MYLRKIGVEENVIAKQLVAIVPVDVRPAQLGLSLGLYAKQALDDYVVDFGPHVRTVNS